MQQEESKTRWVQGEIKVSGRRYKHDNVLLTIWYTPIGRIINDTSSMNNDTATPNNRTSLHFVFFSGINRADGTKYHERSCERKPGCLFLEILVCIPSNITFWNEINENCGFRLKNISILKNLLKKILIKENFFILPNIYQLTIKNVIYVTHIYASFFNI